MSVSLRHLLIALALVLASFALIMSKDTGQATAQITADQGTPTATFRSYTFFASTSPEASNFIATTSTATSTNIIGYNDANGRIDNGQFVVAGAESLEFFFSRAAGSGSNQGSSVFKIQMSPDGITWYDYPKLIQATSSGYTLTQIQPNATISAATTTLNFGVNLVGDAWYSTRCIIQMTTDGSSTCAVTAQY